MIAYSKGKIGEQFIHRMNSVLFLPKHYKKGNVLGIEMLDVSHQIPKKEIGQVYSEMPVYA